MRVKVVGTRQENFLHFCLITSTRRQLLLRLLLHNVASFFVGCFASAALELANSKERGRVEIRLTHNGASVRAEVFLWLVIKILAACELREIHNHFLV